MVLRTRLLLVLLASLPVAADFLKDICTINYLIAGAVGVSVVSSVIAVLVTYYCMKFCQGKKNKKAKEEYINDDVSIQYASLQNLSANENHTIKLQETAEQQKTCYASVADVRKQIQTTANEDVNVINHLETS